MHDSSNPYASPLTLEMHPVAAQWMASGSASLSRVATGLGLIYAGLLSMLFGVMLLVAEYLLRVPELAELAVYGAGLLVLVGLLLDLIGTIFCLATPTETRARGLIYASAASMFLWLLMVIVQVYRTVNRIGLLPPAAAAVEQVLGAISILTFILYLRRLAEFIGRRDLASRATGVFVYYCVLLVVQFGVQLYFATGGQLPEVLAGLVLIVVVVVVYAVALVLYANLVTYLRKAVLGGGGK